MYVIKKRVVNFWDKLGGGTGTTWVEFGQPQKTLEKAIKYAYIASEVFEEKFKVCKVKSY